jgi:Tfp pilus assembly protein PilE
MRAFGLIAVVIVLCAGFLIYQRRATTVMESGSPQEQVDVTAVRQRLLTIAQTERQYQASNGKYATLEELSSENLLPGGTEQRGYAYTAEIRSNGFTITATPSDPTKRDWPTLQVTESMTVTER